MDNIRNLEVLKTIKIKKHEYKDLRKFLSNNDLLDEQELWFAGFDNYRKATNNAVAENLFYGNKKLIIVCIKNNDVFYMNNSKEGLKVRLLGDIKNKFKMTSLRILIHPNATIISPEGINLEIKVTKNKGVLKTFKKVLLN